MKHLGRPTRPGLRVSIVINTLNRAASLASTLRSLELLNHRDFEVIVINGPSVDHTAAVVQEYGERIKFAQCPVASLGVSRNMGIVLASGDIVAFTDDDARPNPEWLGQLLSAYDSESVGAVGGAVFDVPLNRIDWKLCTSTRLGAVNTDASEPCNQYLGRGADPFMYLAGCNMSFRRRVLVELGGFDEALSSVFDDVDVCCGVIDLGYDIRFLPDALVDHDRAPSAMRDQDRRLIDPYQVVRARTVFALHCRVATHTLDDVRATIEEWLGDWSNHAQAELAAGHVTRDEALAFTARAAEGMRDGIASGMQPRSARTFPDPGNFRSFSRSSRSRFRLLR